MSAQFRGGVSSYSTVSYALVSSMYILSNVIGFNSVFFFFFFIFLITNHQLLYVNLSRIQLH